MSHSKWAQMNPYHNYIVDYEEVQSSITKKMKAPNHYDQYNWYPMNF